MKAIDVLGNERMKFAALLERHKSPMAGVRLRGPCGMFKSSLPRQFAYFAIRDVVVYIRHLFSGGIERPQALRSAEILDTRICRNSRARQYNDARGVIDPMSNPFNNC